MRGTVNRVAMMYLVLLMGLGLACITVEVDNNQQVRTVRARVQMKPGGELEEVEMEVHVAATELEVVSADQARAWKTKIWCLEWLPMDRPWPTRSGIWPCTRWPTTGSGRFRSPQPGDPSLVRASCTPARSETGS
jgi:hypothetical protein